MDDSKATNVEATYAGLMGLEGQKCVVLLGGVAKVSFYFGRWIVSMFRMVWLPVAFPLY